MAFLFTIPNFSAEKYMVYNKSFVYKFLLIHNMLLNDYFDGNTGFHLHLESSLLIQKII